MDENKVDVVIKEEVKKQRRSGNFLMLITGMVLIIGLILFVTTKQNEQNNIIYNEIRSINNTISNELLQIGRAQMLQSIVSEVAQCKQIPLNINNVSVTLVSLECINAGDDR